MQGTLWFPQKKKTREREEHIHSGTECLESAKFFVITTEPYLCFFL